MQKNISLAHYIAFIFIISISIVFTQVANAEVLVDININQSEHHLAQVTIALPEANSDTVVLKLPTWRTGRYEILNLSDGVRKFSAKDNLDKALHWRKMNKNAWEITGTKNRKITVSYQLYANGLGKRTRHIDDSHAFLDNSTVVMYSDETRPLQHTINLDVKPSWRSVSGLLTGDHPHQFIAKNYDVLADSPVETGLNKFEAFTVDGREYELVIWGEGNYDIKKMIADLKVMVQQSKSIWHGYPFSRYVFMVHATSGARGATEHLNSTIIQRSRFKFSDRKDYLGFILTAAHEFVHTWNVKQYRPKGLVPYNYQSENYSNLIWLAEGSTSYLQSQLLMRGEVITAKEFLTDLAKRIKAHQRKPGTSSQTVAEASFDTWQSQGGDYGNNHSVNIYSEGFMVSWLLDFDILSQTNLKRSYRDVHNELYQQFSLPKSYDEQDVIDILTKLTDRDYSEWWQDHVHSHLNIDFNLLLAKAGLTLSYGKDKKDNVSDISKAKLTPWTGLKVKKSSHGLEVIAVEKDSPAWQAGITITDIIIAVDGLRLVSDDLKSRLKDFKVAQKVEFSLFRRDQLINKSITLGAVAKEKLKVVPLAKVSRKQKAFFKAWTGLDFPTKE